MNKEHFQNQALSLLNTIGRMMIYQIFQLPLDKSADFVLNLLDFQPNADTKKMLFQELMFILLLSIKQLSRSKKFKFKVSVKGRAEVVTLMKEKKLIFLKEEEMTELKKLQALNTLYEFLLRFLMGLDPEIKASFLQSKQGLEFVRLSESLAPLEGEEAYGTHLLLTFKMFNEMLSVKENFEKVSKPILEYLINLLPKLSSAAVLNGQSLEGLLSLLILLL